jgi:hypothetical protein
MLLLEMELSLLLLLVVVPGCKGTAAAAAAAAAVPDAAGRLGSTGVACKDCAAADLEVLAAPIRLQEQGKGNVCPCSGQLAATRLAGNA